MHGDGLQAVSARGGEAGAVPGGATLELYLAEIRQLFNSMDPAPFRQRDLDPKAAEYIVDWAREAPKDHALSLVVRLGHEATAAGDTVVLNDAVRDFFQGRAVATRKRLRQLFRTGRISLLIGLVFMGAMMLLGEAATSLFSHDAYASLIKESLVIGGWVALWRPAEIFLHEWWPILAEARLYGRLAAMPVRVLAAAAPPGPAA